MWSTLAAVVKLLLSDIPNLQALAISSYISSGFLLIVNLFTDKIKVMKSLKLKDIGIISGLGFIGLFVYSALYYYGISDTISILGGVGIVIKRGDCIKSISCVGVYRRWNTASELV